MKEQVRTRQTLTTHLEAAIMDGLKKIMSVIQRMGNARSHNGRLSCGV